MTAPTTGSSADRSSADSALEPSPPPADRSGRDDLHPRTTTDRDPAATDPGVPPIASEGPYAEIPPTAAHVEALPAIPAPPTIGLGRPLIRRRTDDSSGTDVVAWHRRPTSSTARRSTPAGLPTALRPAGFRSRVLLASPRALPSSTIVADGVSGAPMAGDRRGTGTVGRAPGPSVAPRAEDRPPPISAADDVSDRSPMPRATGAPSNLAPPTVSGARPPTPEQPPSIPASPTVSGARPTTPQRPTSVPAPTVSDARPTTPERRASDVEQHAPSTTLAPSTSVAVPRAPGRDLAPSLSSSSVHGRLTRVLGGPETIATFPARSVSRPWADHSIFRADRADRADCTAAGDSAAPAPTHPMDRARSAARRAGTMRGRPDRAGPRGRPDAPSPIAPTDRAQSPLAGSMEVLPPAGVASTTAPPAGSIDAEALARMLTGAPTPGRSPSPGLSVGTRSLAVGGVKGILGTRGAAGALAERLVPPGTSPSLRGRGTTAGSGGQGGTQPPAAGIPTPPPAPRPLAATGGPTVIRRLIDDKSAPSPSGVGEPDRPAQRLTPADIDEIVNAVERRVLAQLDRRGLRGGR